MLQGSLDRPLYIAIEGPIGVGKTTLARQLRERLNAGLFLEIVEENPFLAEFYADRERYAFQTQLFFLMSRFQQQQKLNGEFTRSSVADYHLLKDRIFAQLTLHEHELALYENVYEALATEVRAPDVMIYLHGDLPLLLDRIRERGRPFERDFDVRYLERLCETYDSFFANYQDAPLLSLDNGLVDFRSDRDAFDVLIQQLRQLAHSKSTFARSPLAL